MLNFSGGRVLSCINGLRVGRVLLTASRCTGVNVNKVNGRKLDQRAALAEAERCLLCEDAPCAKACPAGTRPDKFLRQLRFENPLGAAETVLDNNPLGGICGTVCPVSQLCEKCCTRNALDGPVKIGAVQRYLHDFGIQEKLALPPVPPPSGHKSAIVGAGPAGLSAARELARRGSEVTVFETRSSPGGALTHALSPFRVDHAMVQQEVGRISDMGVRFQHGVDATVTDAETLRAQGFDAVFVSTGLQTSKALPGFTYNGNCLPALAFLESANASMEAAAATYRGKNITVVGGGSVAMDCAVTAKGLGAAHVHVVALESLLDLPADVEEIELARSMGVQIHGETRVVDMQLERERGGGIVLVAPAAGTDDSEASGAIESSFVIVAVGQTLDSTAKELAAGMGCTEDVSHGTKRHTCSCDALVLERGGDSTPAAAPQSMRGIYFGGDMVRTGGDTVVRAVADGKRAAAAMLPTTPVAMRKELSLGLEYCGIMFENPFCLSSSPVTNTADMIAMAYDHGWGGSYFKTLNREDKFAVSHPSPRLSSVHSGLRHNLGVGIQNVEQISDRPLADNLRDISWLRKHYPTKITGVSIMGYSEDDWAYLAAAAEGAGAHILELNFSCPQMARPDAGHHIGQNFGLIERYTAAAKKAVSIPVIAKMTPNITDMVPAALAAQAGGADGISAINTLKSVSHVDLDCGSMHTLPNIHGRSAISGFSGHAGRPIGLRFVAELAQAEQLTIPISGMGGIYSWRDAAEYISLGARNLQVTTSVMQHGTRIVEDMADGLRRYMAQQDISSLDELVGRATSSLVDPSLLDTTTEVVSVIDQNKCIGCGACAIACRHGSVEAISLHRGGKNYRYARVDSEKCIGCELCEFVCPVDAISFETRERIKR